MTISSGETIRSKENSNNTAPASKSGQNSSIKKARENVSSYGDFEAARVSPHILRKSAYKKIEQNKNKASSVAEMKKQLKLERKEAEKKAKEARLAVKRKAKEEKNATRIRHPIGEKLISIISLLVIISLGGITYFVSYFITQDIKVNAEDNNFSINKRVASEAQVRISSLVSSVEMFVNLLDAAADNETEVKSTENMFFDSNKAVAAVYLPATERLFVNTAFFVSRELKRESAAAYFMQESEMLSKAQGGSFELENASMFFNFPLAAVSLPLFSNEKDDAVGIIFSSEEMSESFSSGNVNQSFLVNNDGIVIVHSDISFMQQGIDESDNPVVKEMLESQSENRQFTFRDDDGEEYIGVFKKLREGNGGVITVVKTSIVLEGINGTTRRNIYAMIIILALAVIIIYFFSRSLSVPLKTLTAIVNEINKGNFNTELFAELDTRRKDEIGVLAKSTRNEREILNTFSKLTNKGVTQAIIKKAIDFEPHLKDITIFFSDIRGFTKISDGFKNRFGDESAAEIIGFLNDYMSRMVTCITKTGGVVDKFEGDAIMAAWGVLRNESLDWESMPSSSVTRALKKDEHDKYVEQDALSAITACMAMRYSLMQYNKDAEKFTKEHEGDPKAKYKPHIRIGAGLNSGRATVGFMGSYDKMEFTSIGDPVNLASRTEASNKPCGTDTLITQDTYDILKTKYIKCKENNFTILPENQDNEIVVEQIPVEFEVKGKGKQHFYGVVNMPKFDIAKFFSDDPLFEVDQDCARAVGPKGPRTLSQMRNLLGIPEPDFGTVNLEAEENKIQVASS